MEQLWADISKQPPELPSTSWHCDVLRERMAQVERGELKFTDWDQSLAKLRETDA